MTTPPDELVEDLREAMPFLEILIRLGSRSGDAQVQQLTDGSADFMRKLWPHLDDLTLASFCAYVATNLTSAVTKIGLSQDLVKVAIVFAENAKSLAWSLDTPEAPGQS